jgi:hypothetical protein
MPTFLPSPLLLNSAQEPATGVIATRVTSWFDNDAGIVTPALAVGIIRNGVVFDVTGYEPFVIPATPQGVAVEIVIQLDEKRDGRPQLRDLPRRFVSVPDQAAVTWDDLVDVVPIDADTQYEMPPWAAAIIAVPAQVQDVVAAAEAAAAAAVAAKDAAQAVGETNAGIIAGVLNDPTSAPSIGLAEKYKPDDGGRPVGKSELKAFLRVQTPEMFGAHPELEADDTKAWNDALDWLARNGGTTLEPQAATYFVSSVRMDFSGADWPLQPTNGEPYGFAAPSIVGKGKRVSILKQIAGSTGDVLTISGKTGTQAGPANNNKVNGFVLEKIGIVGTPGGGNGLRMRSIVSSSFEKLWIGHTGKSGIKIDREYFVSGVSDEYAYNLVFSKIDLLACALWGFEHTTSAAVQSTLYDVNALNCGTQGAGEKGGFLLCPTNTNLNSCSAIGCGTGSIEGRGVLVLPTTSATSTNSVTVFQTLRLEGNSRTGGYQMEIVGNAAVAIKDPNVITTPGNYATHFGVGVRDTGIQKNFSQLTRFEGGFISVNQVTNPDQHAIEVGRDSRRTDISATVRFENQGQSIAIADMVDYERGFATTVDGVPIGQYIESLTPVAPDIPEVVVPPKIVVTQQAATDRTISLAWNSALIPSGSSYIVRVTNAVTGVSYTREIIASVGNGVTLTGLTAANAHAITITPKGATDGTASVTTVNISTTAAPTTPTEPTDPTTPGDTSNPVRVGIIGDSNTNGHKGNLVTGIAEGWAYIAQTNGFIEFAGGWANSGATSFRMSQYTPDLSAAEAIVIMAGTNNLSEENTKGNGGELDPVIWLRDIKAIIAKAKNTKVLILAIPPFNVYAPQAKRANVLMANMTASNGWDWLDPWVPYRTADGKWVEGAGQKDAIHAEKATYASVGKSVETFLVNKYRD